MAYAGATHLAAVNGLRARQYLAVDNGLRARQSLAGGTRRAPVPRGQGVSANPGAHPYHSSCDYIPRLGLLAVFIGICAWLAARRARVRCVRSSKLSPCLTCQLSQLRCNQISGPAFVQLFCKSEGVRTGIWVLRFGPERTSQVLLDVTYTWA